MMPFFNRNWVGACWGHWPVLDCWRAGLQAPGSLGLKLDCCSADMQALGVTPLQKQGRRGVDKGFARDRSDV